MAEDDVPARLRPVEEFANSIDVEAGEDHLDSVESFARWLAGHGYPGVTPTQDDLALARGARAALRDELMAHHRHLPGEPPFPPMPEFPPLPGQLRRPPPPAPLRPRERLDEYAAQAPLRVVFRDGETALAPVETGVRGMLGDVFAAMVLAEREGTWHRLKLCREDSCQWVFFDRSKNQSKTWCSMRVCGNRNKTRTYRSRRQG